MKLTRNVLATLQTWLDSEHVDSPQTDGPHPLVHRKRDCDNEQLDFAMAASPIKPVSEEWKSCEAQTARRKEMSEHTNGGTYT